MSATDRSRTDDATTGAGVDAGPVVHVAEHIVGPGGELLETFLSLMPDAAVVVGADGRIVAVNANADALFGYADGSLVGLDVERLVPERFRHRHRIDRSAFAQHPHARAMAAGQDLTGRRADGTEVPVDISLAPIGSADEPLVVAAIRDATERRAATAAQAQLAAIVESSLDGIVATRTDGTIVSWNAGAQRLLGYHPADVLGCHISSLIPPDASEDFEALLDAATRGGASTAMDTEWLRVDGTRLPIALSMSPLVAAGGSRSGFSLVLRDITERKEAERATQELLQDLRHQERWQAANAEIRGAVLSGASAEETTQLVCERARDLFEAAATLVVRLGPTLEVLAASGAAERLIGRTFNRPSGPAPGADAAGRGQGERDELAELREVVGEPSLVARSEVVGRGDLALVVVGSTLEQFREPGQVADGLVTSAAITMQLLEARAAAERVLLAEDRERIARDLHDLVIQRLFATGMSLQSTLSSVGDDRAAERIATAIDSLDRTIAEIRTAIFELHEARRGDTKLRSDLVAIVRRAGEQLGSQPGLRFEGPVDTMVPIDVAAHVVAVVNEALSNVVRHAQATAVSVTVGVQDGQVVLVVQDDGVGIAEGGRSSGLENMRRRAVDLGGAMEIRTAAGEGTTITWRAPLRNV